MHKRGDCSCDPKRRVIKFYCSQLWECIVHHFRTYGRVAVCSSHFFLTIAMEYHSHSAARINEAHTGIGGRGGSGTFHSFFFRNYRTTHKILHVVRYSEQTQSGPRWTKTTALQTFDRRVSVIIHTCFRFYQVLVGCRYPLPIWTRTHHNTPRGAAPGAPLR